MRTLQHCLVIGIALLLASCANVSAPTEQQLESIRSIDVVVSVPDKNFSAGLGANTGFMVLPGGGVSPGAAMGIGLAANLITLGIDYAAMATAREADQPVSATIDDIDMRRTVFEQLKALLPEGRRARLALNPGSVPKMEDGENYNTTLSRFASQSAADATLVLSVAPQFRTRQDPDPRVYSNAILIARSGQILMTASAQFAGPKAPDIERADVVRWWADGRYRRFLLQGIRAALTPVADGLGAAPGHAQRLEALRDKVGRLPLQTTTAVTLRSSHCAVSSDSSPQLLRVERQRQYVLLVALCSADEAAQLPPEADRDLTTIVPNTSVAAIVVPRDAAKVETTTSR